MPLDPSIYSQVGRVNLGQGLSDILDQQRQRQAMNEERQLRLSALAQQKQGLEQQQNQRRNQELNMWLSSAVQSGRPLEEVMPEAIAKGAEIGVAPEVTQRHVTNVYGAATPQARSDVAFTQAYPELVARQRAESMFAKPQKPSDIQLEPVIGPNGQPILVPREKAVGMQPYRAAATNINLGAPQKAQPGFRNVQKDGEWIQEAVPGSKAWQDLKSKEATDRAFVQNTVPSIEKNVKDIDKFMAMEGFDNIFGLTGDLPNILPSSRAAAATRDQVVGAMETAGFNLMKSTSGSAGTMSQQEWPKMQTYLNILKNTTDPKQAREALIGAKESYARMKEIAKESYMNEWGTGQFGNPDVIKRLEASSTPTSTPNAAGYDADKEARYQAWKASQGR